MLRGLTESQIHAGTWCRVSGEGHDGELCVVLGFEADASLWRVGLGDNLFEPEASLNVLLVPELALTLEFCLLPQALDKAVAHPMVATETAQGTCGRGLIVTGAVKRGCPLFEEPPFMIVHKVPSSIVQHHGPRWRAYSALRERGSSGPKDGLWATALKQFEDLDYDREEIKHVRDGAAAIMLDEKDEDVRTSAEARTAGIDRVQETLMRFHCNQFNFENGSADTGNAALSADALYALARANHLCEPTIAFANQFRLAKKRGKPLAMDEGKVCVCEARLAAGERLCHSYLMMPSEWDYVQGRLVGQLWIRAAAMVRERGGGRQEGGVVLLLRSASWTRQWMDQQRRRLLRLQVGRNRHLNPLQPGATPARSIDLRIALVVVVAVAAVVAVKALRHHVA